MKSIPVLYLNPTAQLGGAEYSLLDLVANLDPGRFAVRIACLGDGPLVRAASARGIAVDLLHAPAAFVRSSVRGRRTGPARMAMGIAQGIPTAWRIRRLARTRRVAIVHSNGNKTHLLSAIACFGSWTRLVWHVRDFLPDRPLERRLVWWANRKVRAVVANSAAVASHLVAMGMRSDLVHAIPNGIDCDRFSPEGPMAPLRQVFGWPRECKVVGIIGMLAAWKGQPVFLRAAREALDRRPDVRFVVVGDEIYQTDGHGNFKEELVRLVSELGLHDALAFTGYREDVPEVIRALDVVVHASVEPEPFGRIVAEAMACGRPVIATEAGGVPEVLGTDGTSGLLVPPADVPAMASAIFDLVQDQERRARMGQAGRDRAILRFSIEEHVRAVEKVYEEVL